MSNFDRFNLIPPSLTHAINQTIYAFREAELRPPTTMIVGEDIQRMFLYAGFRPVAGTWGTIMGIEIRGVSDYIARLMEGHIVMLPPHLQLPTFKTQVLGKFSEPNDKKS